MMFAIAPLSPLRTVAHMSTSSLSSATNGRTSGPCRDPLIVAAENLQTHRVAWACHGCGGLFFSPALAAEHSVPDAALSS